jgi:hypothetical protein
MEVFDARVVGLGCRIAEEAEGAPIKCQSKRGAFLEIEGDGIAQ